ncbi:hypothetical protein ACUSIJ_16280 [Pseudochelatococcus sp. B33]
MTLARGILANIYQIPPLIFRFQYNPTLLQERKRYKWQQSNATGQWIFDQAAAASGAFDTLKGIYEDLKEFGPLLTATKPYEALEGEPRKFTLEFKLDALEPGPRESGSHFGGSIEPDLAVLRSFMYPSWDALDILSTLANGIFTREWNLPCWNAPPMVTLVYGPLSYDCIMEDLDIKITEFQGDLSPARAEVKVSLAEQTHSTTPFSDFVIRKLAAGRALGRPDIGRDFAAATPLGVPIYTSLENVF